MKPSGINMSIIWLLLITIVTFIDHSNGIAVMSIDIGSESMKVAIVSVSKLHFIIKLLMYFIIYKFY